jgi:hypothetical protein
MEGELFDALYEIVQQEAKLRSRKKRVCYSDALIVVVYFWAVLHDRAVCWACEPSNWPKEMEWMSLPSTSTMSRRLRSLSCWMLITALYQRLQIALSLAGSDPQLCLCRRIDSKPLVVGGFSKDRDAKRGYATGGLGRGYKIAGAWGKSVLPEALVVAPLKVSDQQSAMELINQLHENGKAPSGYLLADATHDTNPLHQHASEHCFQLITPRKKPGAELGHRNHCPGRLRSIQLLEAEGQFGRQMYKMREPIERDFAHLCSFGGGLQPLPSFVRRPRRVVRWIIAKLIIRGLRHCQTHGLAA